MNTALPSQTDTKLKRVIEQLFIKYDTDRRGSLTREESHSFLNQALKLLDIPTQISMKQVDEAVLHVFDKNWDGRLSRQEMYSCLKHVLQLELSGRRYFEELKFPQYTPVPSVQQKPHNTQFEHLSSTPTLKTYTSDEMDKILQAKPQSEPVREHSIRMISSLKVSDSPQVLNLQEDISSFSPVIEHPFRNNLLNSDVDMSYPVGIGNVSSKTPSNGQLKAQLGCPEDEHPKLPLQAAYLTASEMIASMKKSNPGIFDD